MQKTKTFIKVDKRNGKLKYIDILLTNYFLILTEERTFLIFEIPLRFFTQYEKEISSRLREIEGIGSFLY